MGNKYTTCIFLPFLGGITAFDNCWGFLEPYVASYLRHYDSSITTSQVHILFTLSQLAHIFGSQFFHPICIHLGYREGLLISTLVMSCTYFIFWMSSSIYPMFLAAFLSGFSVIFRILIGGFLMIGLFPETPASALGIANAGGSLGPVLYGNLARFIMNPENKKPTISVIEGNRVGRYFDAQISNRFPSFCIACILLDAGVGLILTPLMANPEGSKSILAEMFCGKSEQRSIQTTQEEQKELEILEMRNSKEVKLTQGNDISTSNLWNRLSISINPQPNSNLRLSVIERISRSSMTMVDGQLAALLPKASIISSRQVPHHASFFEQEHQMRDEVELNRLKTSIKTFEGIRRKSKDNVDVQAKEDDLAKIEANLTKEYNIILRSPSFILLFLNITLLLALPMTQMINIKTIGLEYFDDSVITNFAVIASLSGITGRIFSGISIDKFGAVKVQRFLSIIGSINIIVFYLFKWHLAAFYICNIVFYLLFAFNFTFITITPVLVYGLEMGKRQQTIFGGGASMTSIMIWLLDKLFLDMFGFVWLMVFEVVFYAVTFLFISKFAWINKEDEEKKLPNEF